MKLLKIFNKFDSKWVIIKDFSNDDFYYLDIKKLEQNKKYIEKLNIKADDIYQLTNEKLIFHNKTYNKAYIFENNKITFFCNCDKIEKLDNKEWTFHNKTSKKTFTCHKKMKTK